MELNSPRKDPYSPSNQAVRKFKDEGFTETFSVKSKNEMQTPSGKSFGPDQVSINHIERAVDKENESEKKMVLAISCNDGTKGTLKATWGEESNETILQFLAKADEKQNFANFFS